jgi:glucokinase
VEPVVGIDLGATHLRVALVAGGRLGRVHVRKTADLTSPSHDRDYGIVPALAEAVRESVEHAVRGGDGTVDGRDRPLAAGIGIAGFVDLAGDLIDATPFGVPSGRVLRTVLETELGIPVVVDNDANMAALGELEQGIGRTSRDFVLMTLGTNIGGAIVENGRLRRGAHGVAGEFGLILVPARRGSDGRAAGDAGRAAGDAWRLGQGATWATPGYAYLEDLVGGRALARAPRSSRDIDQGPVPSVFVAAERGDVLARSAVGAAIEGWALLIAGISVVLDPALVVLSGGLVEEAGHYLDPLRGRVAQLTPFAPEIRIAELGAAAGLAGAAVAARGVIGTPEARQEVRP